VLGHFTNASMINAVLERLNPQINERFIDIDPQGFDHVLELEPIVANGGLVGILGDRSMPGARSIEVEFMGRKAAVPTGPYLLAAVLKCPVYLTFALFHAPNRYDLYCEPFVEKVVLRRGPQQAADLQPLAQRYVDRLEHYCRQAPYNWFNFFDFWATAKTKTGLQNEH
jgi:predicted LPLAT superfamily acyltransferase